MQPAISGIVFIRFCGAPAGDSHLWLSILEGQ